MLSVLRNVFAIGLGLALFATVYVFPRVSLLIREASRRRSSLVATVMATVIWAVFLVMLVVVVLYPS